MPSGDSQSISVNLGSDFGGGDASTFPFPLATATLFFGRCFLDDFCFSGDTKVGSLIRDKFRLELGVKDAVGFEDCFALPRARTAGDVGLGIFFALDAAVAGDDCEDGDFLRDGDDGPALSDLPERRFGAALGDADGFIFPVLPMIN